MNISYTKNGDYLLPVLILEDKKQYNIGKYGLLRLNYIKKYKLGLYFDLLIVAFYLANGYSRHCLSDCPLKNHINSAIDIFNCRCDIGKFIPKIKEILKIKYNLIIVKDNPMILKQYY